jgi:glycosyl-4,4'-diaponeurosporenoate acyltransferase
MRIIYLSDQNAFVIDIIIWIILHLSIGFCSSRIPDTWFNPEKRLYRIRKWEKGGILYEKIFHVRSWKCYLPNGGALYPRTFSIKNLSSYNIDYLERWLRESCRAEFCHWMMILPSILFFFWNDYVLGCWMVIYAILNNIFPIVVQRFNRPRMQHVLDQMKKSLTARNDLCEESEKTKIYSNSYC